jgi:WD40 repeat protein
VSSIAADPRGIVVGLADGHVDFVDPATGAVRDGFVAGSTWPGAVKRSPDGAVFGVAEDDGVALMDATTGARIRLLATGGVHMLGLAFSPDGSQVAGAGADGTLRVWDRSTGHLEGVVPANAGFLLAVAYSPSGGLLATGGTDGTVRLFDPATLAPIGRPLPGPDSWAYPAFLDDSTLMAGFADGSVRAYDIDVHAWIARACAIAGRELTVPAWCSVTA